MQQAKSICEKGFWLLLLFSPLLDLVNGILTYLSAGGTGGMLSSLDIPNASGVSFSFVIRMVFLLLMVVYLFLRRSWKGIAVFCAIGITWLLTILYEQARGISYSLSADIQYIVRFCYCLLSLVIYFLVFRQTQDRTALRNRVDQVLCLSTLILGLGVLVPYVLGMGFYTYADPLGYRGSRGFFYAGNDITVVMMLLLPIVLAGWMEQKNLRSLFAWGQAVGAALCFVSMLLIGTKAAFLAVAVTAAVMPVYGILFGIIRKKWTPLLRCLTVFLLIVLLMALLTLICETGPLDTIHTSISATGDYTDIAGPETVIFSGRTATVRSAWADFKAALPLSALVGIGRGSQSKLMEMDLFEVFFYYGILGTLSMLWLYVSQGIRIVIDLFRKFSLRALSCCVALALCVGFLAMAGHTLFSVTAGFYFAFMIVYARMFCAE